MLKIKKPIVTDTSITSIQHHSYSPYTSAFNNQDEIRISIQSQDLLLLPHDSYIYIEGSINAIGVLEEGVYRAALDGNYIGFLFDSISYEINGVEIDRNKNVGLTSLIKGALSLTTAETSTLAASFNDYHADDGSFSTLIPLKFFLGFAEDYKNIVMNVKHELILNRSRNDLNCFVGTNNNQSISISKIQWRMPHVKVDDYTKLKLLKHIEQKDNIEMSFRSWDLYEYPALPPTDKHIWNVKTTSNLNKPRYVILALQTNRNNNILRTASDFDHCNVTDVRVHLNSECYPYESINTRFDKNQASILYNMFVKFQESYYHDGSKTPSSVTVTYTKFLLSPLFVFDCSRQNESLKNSTVDVKVEIQCRNNIPPHTAAYCLIIYDNLISYNPYTNIVAKCI